MRNHPPSDAAPSESGRNKRRHRRESAQCLVWVESNTDGQRGEVARTVDISPGGAGLILAQPIAVKTRVVVDLLLPRINLRLRAHGEVVHASSDERAGYRVGVRFDSPPVLVDSVSIHQEGAAHGVSQR